MYESENLQAFVRLNRSGKWCALQTKVRLYVRNDSVFGGEKKELNALLANLPGVLWSQCNKVRTSSVKVLIGGRPVYTAFITTIDSTPRITERIADRKIADKYRQAIALAAPKQRSDATTQ